MTEEQGSLDQIFGKYRSNLDRDLPAKNQVRASLEDVVRNYTQSLDIRRPVLSYREGFFGPWEALLGILCLQLRKRSLEQVPKLDAELDRQLGADKKVGDYSDLEGDSLLVSIRSDLSQLVNERLQSQERIPEKYFGLLIQTITEHLPSVRQEKEFDSVIFEAILPLIPEDEEPAVATEIRAFLLSELPTLVHEFWQGGMHPEPSGFASRAPRVWGRYWSLVAGLQQKTWKEGAKLKKLSQTVLGCCARTLAWTAAYYEEGENE